MTVRRRQSDGAFERDGADFDALKVCVGKRNGAANADREVAGSAEVMSDPGGN